MGHPFAATARLAKGTVLRVEPQGPAYDTARYGEVPTVDAAATCDQDSGGLALFVVNRSQAGPVELTVGLRAFDSDPRFGEAWTLTDDDLRATNTQTAPDRVTPRPLAAPAADGTRRTLVLPPVSWSAVTWRVDRA